MFNHFMNVYSSETAKVEFSDIAYSRVSYYTSDIGQSAWGWMPWVEYE